MSEKVMTVGELIAQLEQYDQDQPIVVGAEQFDYCRKILGERPDVGEAWLTERGTLVNEEGAEKKREDGDEVTEVVVIGACPGW